MNDFFSVFTDCLKESLLIIFIIFLLMVCIELLVLRFKKNLIDLSVRNRYYAYVISSLFGFIPGCVGMFAMDSLYMAGLLSFGGLVSTMLASIGDEIAILFSLVIKGDISVQSSSVLLLVLFILGIIGGISADWISKKIKLKFSDKCLIEIHEHDYSFSFSHFFKHHVLEHIIKKHIWKIFAWIFATLLLMSFSKDIIGNITWQGSHPLVMILLAALIGLIPMSGPGTIFFFMFAQGSIPFSVLLTNCIVQDGHGMLPILGFSFHDALKIKIFNLILGLLVGTSLLFFGF